MNIPLLAFKSIILLLVTIIVAPTSTHANGDKKTTSAKLKITNNEGSALGIKITEDSNGAIVMSLCEINGDNLLLIPLGLPKEGYSKDACTTTFKTKEGASINLELHRKGILTTSVEGIKFDPVQYFSDNDMTSSQGLFSWLGDLVHDAVVVIGAGLAWLTDSWVQFKLSGGGLIWVHGSNDIGIKFGNGNFKLEPGLEEDPTVWY